MNSGVCFRGWAALAVLLATAVFSPAQNILLKDGRTVEGKNLRRSGESVMSTVMVGASQGEIGYSVGTIAKIDFPEPPQLKAVEQLLFDAKASDALAQIEPVITAQAPFREIPGSWWSQAALLKLSALTALDRGPQAEQLIKEMVSFTGDPETARAGKVRQAAKAAKTGDKAAVAVLEAAVKESKRTETIADAWLNIGHAHLAAEEFQAALLSYLRLPVFYPGEKLLMPAAILGSAKAYLGIEDLERAKRAMDELIAGYPASPEAATAKTEVVKIERKLKASAKKTDEKK
jgi:tetratricopeptide (TPR) repeat protein